MNLNDFKKACIQHGSSQYDFLTFTRTAETQIINSLKVAGSSTDYFYNIDWGNGTNVTVQSNTAVGHTYTNSGQNIVRITPTNSTRASIVKIEFNLGVPEANRVGGILDISSFPNLNELDIRNTNITSIRGFQVLSKLSNLQLSNNEFTQQFLDLSRNTDLQVVSLAINNFTGSIPSNLPPQLKSLNCSDNLLTGSIPSLPPSIELFNCLNQHGEIKITGNIPNLSNLTNLKTFNCNSNQVSGVVSGFAVSNTVSNFSVRVNSLTSSVVDAILLAFVTAGRQGNTDDVLNLGGTGNAAPTSVGLDAKATLISRNWSVTTN